MIKKLTQALLALTLVGGMTACDKSMKGVDEGTTSATGDTYMSVTFSTTNPNSTRAAVKEDTEFNSIGEYVGRDEIKNVHVYVINLPQENVDHKVFTTTTPNPDGDDTTNDFRTEAWKTTPGDKIVYVYVNISGTDIETELNKATSKAAFEAANKKAYALTANGAVKDVYAKYEGGKDIIAMNSTKGVDLTVVAGVKKAEAEAMAPTTPKNRAKVSVRRLVAQAAVTSTAATFEIKSGETTIATLGNLKWDVMQFEKTTFLAPQAEGTNDAMLAKYCKSPSFDFVTDNATYPFTSASDKYEYRAFTGAEVKTFTRNTDNKENVKAIVATPMKFITETTHQYGDKLAADGGTAPFTGYRKGNTTYVIVAAQITPDDAAWAEGEKANYQANGDLFLGVQDHKFYASPDKAKAANKSTSDLGADRDNVIKYTGGLCYYIAWLNPDVITDPVKSPVLRNNIYHVNVTGMKRLGYSGNPFNPNGDDPKDPDDKTPDPKETLYPVDTYMAVEISVVNWGVHSFDQEL